MELHDSMIDNMISQAEALAREIAAIEDEEEKIRALNRVREILHEVSPFKEEPVDLVLWEKGENVSPNDYNPNVVHTEEWKLLLTSLRESRYAMGIVVHRSADGMTIVDGEHRWQAATQTPDIRHRLRGYVPVSVLGTKTEAERKAATVYFNRARGIHAIEGMGRIVRSMVAAGWDDVAISEALGMTSEELLRLKQVAGIAAHLASREYGRAWEIT